MHCPHTTQHTAVNKSIWHQEIQIFIRKNLGNVENQTRVGWVRSMNATSVLCRPPQRAKCLLIFIIQAALLSFIISKWKSGFLNTNIFNGLRLLEARLKPSRTYKAPFLVSRVDRPNLSQQSLSVSRLTTKRLSPSSRCCAKSHCLV